MIAKVCFILTRRQFETCLRPIPIDAPNATVLERDDFKDLVTNGPRAGCTRRLDSQAGDGRRSRRAVWRARRDRLYRQLELQKPVAELSRLTVRFFARRLVRSGRRR